MSKPAATRSWCRWACLSLAVALTACERPGLYGLGTGEASIDGDGDALRGVCTYSIGTRWGTPLPHELRLEDDGSDGSLVIRARRRYRAGAQDVGGNRRFVTRATFMEGQTVRGAVTGTLTVDERGDSLHVVLAGRRMYRDTVDVRARCSVRTS